jgi:hypothetical protein
MKMPRKDIGNGAKTTAPLNSRAAFTNSGRMTSNRLAAGRLSRSFQKYAYVFPPDRSLAVAARNEAAYRAATARERYVTRPQNTSP